MPKYYRLWDVMQAFGIKSKDLYDDIKENKFKGYKIGKHYYLDWNGVKLVAQRYKIPIRKLLLFRLRNMFDKDSKLNLQYDYKYNSLQSAILDLTLLGKKPKEVAEFLNSNGYRKSDGSLFTADDVSSYKRKRHMRFEIAKRMRGVSNGSVGKPSKGLRQGSWRNVG